MKIYVDSIIGCDQNNGTEKSPLKTLERARDLAKEHAPDMNEDIVIYLKGKFCLKDTFKLNHTHSGQNGYNIIYTSLEEEKAVITMADEYTDFTLHDKEKNIWKVYVGKGTYSRQVYFNDIRGIRSRTLGYLKNAEYVDGAYYLCDNTELLELEKPEDVDMIFHINWCNPRYKIASVEKTPEGRIKITPNAHFQKHKGRIDFAGASRLDSTPGYLENAYEFLDQPREWYINSDDGYLYYIPDSDENMETMTVKIPKGERLIDACGEDGEHTVSNIVFDNLYLEGTTWLKVDRDGGFHDAQNGHIREKDGRMTDSAPGAAVHFEHCRNIKMTNNIIRQHGRTGVEFMAGSKYVEFIGNEVYDISGVGVTVDDVGLTGFPDKRSEETFCEYIKVNNNYIRNVGRDYKSSAAVSFAWPRHSQFNHNEICAVPYSGFHGLYGWEEYAETGSVCFDVEVNYNYVHDVFTDRVYDGGCIYTLGASSLECEKTNIEKNNRMWGNYVANSWTCAMIYPDEGSTSWYVRDNVIDTSRVKFLENNLMTKQEKSPWAVHMHASTIMWMTFENNYSTADYAYNYGWMNMKESNIEPMRKLEPCDWENWPEEAKNIMESAGIEEEYKKNFNLDAPKVLVCDDRRKSLRLNTKTHSGFYVLGGKNKEFPISDYKLTLWLSDPEAVTLTDDGYYIAHKKGAFEGEVMATFCGRTYMHHVLLECGDEIERLALNIDSINILEGAQAELKLTAYYTFGAEKDVTADAGFEFVPEKPIVAFEKSKNSQGNSVIKVKALGEKDKTTVKARIEYDGILQEYTMPARIIAHSSDEACTLSAKKVDLTSSWKNTGIKTSDGGLLVSGSPNHHGTKFKNELINFDMSINPGSNWPSIAICDSDQMGDYQNNDCYMLTFKEDYVGFQRFNEGKRTVIFDGSKEIPCGIAGSGAPHNGVFAYNKRVNITVGALDTQEGTRIILNIDGKNIIDYTDNDKSKLPAFGLFVVYNPDINGTGTTFWTK